MPAIALLNDYRFFDIDTNDVYMQNVLLEDRLLIEAFNKKGYEADRVDWQSAEVVWAKYDALIIRACWNYHEHVEEFTRFLEERSKHLKVFNPLNIVKWNRDKHYLQDLENSGVEVIKGEILETGSTKTLKELFESTGYERAVIKPCISAAARHTYNITPDLAADHEEIFAGLLKNEAMFFQEFQKNIVDQGEVSLMYFGDQYSHAVLKKAKTGDFRVQDDYGGTLHHFDIDEEQKELADKIMAAIPEAVAYTRIDLCRNNKGNWAVVELELIEPEIWLRRSDSAAAMLVDALLKQWK